MIDELRDAHPWPDSGERIYPHCKADMDMRRMDGIRRLPSTVQRSMATSAPSSTWSRSTMPTLTRGIGTGRLLWTWQRKMAGRRPPLTSASSMPERFRETKQSPSHQGPPAGISHDPPSSIARLELRTSNNIIEYDAQISLQSSGSTLST